MFAYYLGIHANSSTLDVDQELQEILRVVDLLEAHDKWPALTVSIVDRVELENEDLEYYQTELGVPVTTEITYMLNAKTGNFDEFDMAWASMCTSAAKLVDKVDATAVFVFQLDTVEMRRFDGVLYLSEDTHWWKDPAVFPYLPSPVEFRSDLDSMVPSANG